MSTLAFLRHGSERDAFHTALTALQHSPSMQHALAQPGGWELLLPLASQLTATPDMLGVLDTWLDALVLGRGALASVLPFVLLISLPAKRAPSQTTTAAASSSRDDAPPCKRARGEPTLVEALAQRLADGLATYQALPTAVLMSMCKAVMACAQAESGTPLVLAGSEAAGAAGTVQRPAQSALDTILDCLSNCHRAHALERAQPDACWDGGAIEDEFELKGRVIRTEWSLRLRCVMRLHVPSINGAGWKGNSESAVLDSGPLSIKVLVGVRDDHLCLENNTVGAAAQYAITFAAVEEQQLDAVAEGAPLDSCDFKYHRMVWIDACSRYLGEWEWAPWAHVQQDFPSDMYTCLRGTHLHRCVPAGSRSAPEASAEPEPPAKVPPSRPQECTRRIDERNITYVWDQILA